MKDLWKLYDHLKYLRSWQESRFCYSLFSLSTNGLIR